jgi:Sigma 54 modulation protein / S30EA ribosomal protein
MTILFNTDKTISGEDKHREYFSELIAKELKNYDSHITRIEAHLSDENGKKEGPNDIRCVLEVRLENKSPLAATNQADTEMKAIAGAISKVKKSLATTISKGRNH